MTMERPAVEQGQTTQLFCKVAVTSPFEGKAKVTIYGLPAKVTTQVLELTKDTKELAFPIVADKTSPAGKHGGIFAQVVIDKGGELITGEHRRHRVADRRAAAAEGRGRNAGTRNSQAADAAKGAARKTPHAARKAPPGARGTREGRQGATAGEEGRATEEAVTGGEKITGY